MVLRLALTGDSMVTRRHSVPEMATTASLYALLAASDVVFTNLEVVPIDGRGHPAADVRGTYLNAPSRVVDDLLALGVNLLSCANNHTLNFGTRGVELLIDILESKDVAYSGIGVNLAMARLPTYLDGPHGSCALISCTSTFRPGEQAGAQKHDFAGRPGINPLTVTTTYEVAGADYDVLERLCDELGLRALQNRAVERGMRVHHLTEDELIFADGRFRRAERSVTCTRVADQDAIEISRAVREARRRADTVIVSIHSHGAGESESDPPDFLPSFARHMIDEGADVVVAHGPHCLRGMEIHQGKPIFYSLGNFIAQNEYVARQPVDTYKYLGVPLDASAADLAEKRSNGGTRGFVAHRRYWESILPICDMRHGQIESILIYPLSLGFGLAAPHRGRPTVATGAAATDILERFGDLSAPFGTSLEISDGIASLQLRL